MCHLYTEVKSAALLQAMCHLYTEVKSEPVVELHSLPLYINGT
jgi:hypothetical protein